MQKATIFYATTMSPLGAVLVARSARGLCSILLADDAAKLRSDLAAAFPGSLTREDPEALRQVLDDFEALLALPTSCFDHPLDLGGTPFQQRVWQALRAIPAGSTTTYTDIAAGIGRPDAVRAVAGACASNRHAVAIPCHRVLRRDGALSGYRWGVERKRRLLALEAPGHLEPS